MYMEDDLEWMVVITCLKDTDMSIKDIKKFVALCALGDCTLEERRQNGSRSQEECGIKNRKTATTSRTYPFQGRLR